MKRLHNREVGRNAILEKVFKGGEANKEIKEKLFPQDVTHNQVLGMTGKLKAPNPHILPPMPKLPKKWLGDHKGKVLS